MNEIKDFKCPELEPSLRSYDKNSLGEKIVVLPQNAEPAVLMTPGEFQEMPKTKSRWAQKLIADAKKQLDELSEIQNELKQMRGVNKNASDDVSFDDQFNSAMNEATKHVIRVSVMKKSKELQKQLKEAQDYLL